MRELTSQKDFELKSKNLEIANLLLYGKVKDDYVDGMAAMYSNYNALKRKFNNLNEQEFIQKYKFKRTHDSDKDTDIQSAFAIWNIARERARSYIEIIKYLKKLIHLYF